MGVRVIADEMPVAPDAPHQLRVARRPRAGEEEPSLDVVPVEGREDRQHLPPAASVVEGKPYALGSLKHRSISRIRLTDILRRDR